MYYIKAVSRIEINKMKWFFCYFLSDITLSEYILICSFTSINFQEVMSNLFFIKSFIKLFYSTSLLFLTCKPDGFPSINTSFAWVYSVF